MDRTTRTRSLTTHSIRRLAAGLGTMAMAFGLAALGLTAAGPADAATARASAMTINPIALNTANFSGSAGFGSRAPAWYKDSSGVIHLQGAVTQTSSSGLGASVIGALPAAARPAANVYTIVHTFNGTYADLVIQSNGQIGLISPRQPAIQDYSFVSLEGISYRPSLAGSFIQIAGPDWSGVPTFGSRDAKWYKDSSGVIHLEGSASQTHTIGSDPNMLGLLPKAARPANDLYFVVHTFNGTYADLVIEPDGNISVINPRPPAVQDYSFVSLESITFRPKPVANSITSIGADWSPFAGFDSRVPAWFKDSSGVIHLQGAAKQTSTGGATPNLIATLPPAARPASTVYTVVHTFNGTYADLSIAPNGQIAVINPRPPAVQDYNFVSLEGITYLP
jgi:hypothetical protein